MNPVLAVGLLVVVGLFGGAFARRLNFPTISGYILVGIALSLLGLVPEEMVNGSLSVIPEVSLGIIGYLVGGSLEVKRLRQFGRIIMIVTPFQALGPWLLVTVLLTVLGPLLLGSVAGPGGYWQVYLAPALLVGAIACATAPAASVAIVRECRARGPLTTTLLAIIALDDAIAVIAYAVGSAVAMALLVPSGGMSVSGMLVSPVLSLLGAVGLGLGLGMALVFFSRYGSSRTRLLAAVLGTVLLGVGVAKLVGVSGILVTMALGFVVVNRLPENTDLFEVIHDIGDVVFAMFFTLAGAHFDLGTMETAGLVAVTIFVARSLGKFAGARLGASVAHAPPMIKKYLGFGLLPTAGVAVGLAMLAKQHPAFADLGSTLVSAVLAAVVINELIAPPLTRYALIKSGEGTRCPVKSSA